MKLGEARHSLQRRSSDSLWSYISFSRVAPRDSTTSLQVDHRPKDSLMHPASFIHAKASRPARVSSVHKLDQLLYLPLQSQRILR